MLRVATKNLERCREQLGLAKQGTDPSQIETAVREVYNAEVKYNYCEYYPRDEVFRKPPNLINHPNPRKARGIRLWRQVEACMKDGTLLDLQAGGRPRVGLMQDQRQAGEPNSSENTTGQENMGLYRENVELSESLSPSVGDREGETGSDGEVILNIEQDGYRDPPSDLIGEYAEEDDQYLKDIADLQSVLDQPGDDTEEESDLESDDDSVEMLDDSEHNGSLGEALHPRPSTSQRKARVLSDLQSDDLDAQVRYFHVTKDRSSIPLDLPVRCLVCAETGHIAADCEMLICNACAAYNKHGTHNCPALTKCAKCRESGHNQSACPYKLKKMARTEFVCDLCQQRGHPEDECELQWRTSGKPWDMKLSKGKVALYCYECGRSGHLGNDCSTRRPGKAMGTSSWSFPGNGPRLNTNNGLSIKGRAQGNSSQTIDLTQENDDSANFYRPNPPKPASKGQIRMNIGASQSVQTSAPACGNPINRPGQYPDYRDDSSRRPYSDTYNDRGSYTYWPDDRRSVSPRLRDGKPNYRSDRYVPPQVPPQVPHWQQHESYAPRPNSYRPMPSAGQKAWSTHRR